MRKLRFLLLVGAAAAGAAYFLHPEHGPGRRERAQHWLQTRLGPPASWNDEEVDLARTTITESRTETIRASHEG